MRKSAAVALIACLPLGAAPLYAKKPAETAAAQPVPVNVLGLAAGSDAIALSAVDNPAVAVTITLQNASAKPAEVKVDVTPFRAPSDDAVAKVDPPSATIAPNDIQQFVVRATLPAAATYSAVARVIQGGTTTRIIRIDVTRTKAKPPVEVGDVSTVQETASLFHRPKTVSLPMSLYATGAAVALPPPLLQSATLKHKADATTGEAVGVEIDRKAIPESIRVAPGSPQPLQMSVLNVRAPGRYDLKLRFAAPGFDVVDKDVTIYVRDSWAIALLWIALGVAASLILHLITGTILPRKQLERRVARVLEDLRGLAATGAPDETRALAQEVRDAMRTQWEDARFRGLALAPQIDLYEQLVPALRNWGTLRVQAAAVHPVEVRQQLLDILDAAAAPFVDSPLVADSVASSIATLKAFPKTLREKVDAGLRAQLTVLNRELRGDARPEAVRVRNALLLAQQKLDGGQVEAAVGAFDTARLQYAVLIADDLRRRLGKAAALSAGERSAMSADLDRAAASSDADEAMDAVAVVDAQLINVMIGVLRAEAKPLGDAAKPALDAIDAAQTAADDKRYAEAWNDLDAARKKLDDAVPVGSKMGPAAPSAGADAALDLIARFDMPPPVDTIDIPGAVARSGRQLFRLKLVGSLIVLIAAGLIGLQVLWADNPVWGSLLTRLTAFGWGFALDQFTYAGIIALRPR